MRRAGRSCIEYLCQIKFVRWIDAEGEHHSAIGYAPPLPLTQGLGSDAMFAAGCAFTKTLREIGHRGVAINSYSFDRKGYAKLMRFFRQRHRQQESRWGSSENESRLLSLTEWTVSTACALHDLHNALKWSMHAEFNDLQLLKDIFIIYQSVRNGFDEIQQFLCLWLLQNTEFVDEDQLPARCGWRWECRRRGSSILRTRCVYFGTQRPRS